MISEWRVNIFWDKSFPPEREHFPCEGNFLLRSSAPFPSEWPVFPMKWEFEKKERKRRENKNFNNFLWLQRKIMIFPCDGEFTSSHFLAQKLFWELDMKFFASFWGLAPPLSSDLCQTRGGESCGGFPSYRIPKATTSRVVTRVCKKVLGSVAEFALFYACFGDLLTTLTAHTLLSRGWQFTPQLTGWQKTL